MKQRNDFVTNSSSSSFIIARKPELNDRQKDAIVDFVVRHFLGERLVGPNDSPEDTADALKEIDEMYEYWGESIPPRVRKALEDGLTVYGGELVFDGREWDLADIHEQFWNVIEASADSSADFVPIDTDLAY